MSEPRVVVDEAACADPHLAPLIRELGLPSANEGEPHDWVLTADRGALVLRREGEPASRPLQVDMVRLRKRYKTLPIAKRGPLARALGRHTRTLIDATAGWGKDTVLAWMMGYDVVAVERSPIIGALLIDGLRRFRDYQAAPRYPEIVVADARTYLSAHGADCVYLDPMFPTRGKASALARRPLRVLRELVGDDPDRAHLFECAWGAASGRVVTKRPPHAKPWRRPDHSFSGKMMCYDVYLKRP